MSPKRRSIGEKLNYAKSPEAKAATLDAWANSWRHDEVDIINRLHNAADRGDLAEVRIIAADLGKLINVHHPALLRIFKRLIKENHGV